MKELQIVTKNRKWAKQKATTTGKWSRGRNNETYRTCTAHTCKALTPTAVAKVMAHRIDLRQEQQQQQQNVCVWSRARQTNDLNQKKRSRIARVLQFNRQQTRWIKFQKIVFEFHYPSCMRMQKTKTAEKKLKKKENERKPWTVARHTIFFFSSILSDPLF